MYFAAGSVDGDLLSPNWFWESTPIPPCTLWQHGQREWCSIVHVMQPLFHRFLAIPQLQDFDARWRPALLTALQYYVDSTGQPLHRLQLVRPQRAQEARLGTFGGWLIGAVLGLVLQWVSRLLTYSADAAADSLGFLRLAYCITEYLDIHRLLSVDLEPKAQSDLPRISTFMFLSNSNALIPRLQDLPGYLRPSRWNLIPSVSKDKVNCNQIVTGNHVSAVTQSGPMPPIQNHILCSDACRTFSILLKGVMLRKDPVDVTNLSTTPPVVAFVHTDMATQMSIGLVALQLTLMILVLGFTSPNSLYRIAGLPLISVCTYLELPYVRNMSNNLLQAFVGATGVYVNILYIDTVLLHKWSFESKGPASALGGLKPVLIPRCRQKGNAHSLHESSAQRLLFGAEIGLQSRFPTTKWPIKNIPAFRLQDPAHKPTKSEFLRRSTMKLALCVLLLDLTSLAPKGDNAIDFGDSRIPFFSRVYIITQDELITRIAGILGYWTVQYVIIQAVYACFAIVAVTFDITAPDSWPPVFGSVSDSYSLRRFWG
ncbi:hypothetical protein VTL71DRAFT_9168 [Oculimacula yallundae]|uniref:Uncharacterized protein n=1 Tax=Oculimacula yallundae TaxID=86028 RepID=A0ABR4BT33_9HELO